MTHLQSILLGSTAILAISGITSEVRAAECGLLDLRNEPGGVVVMVGEHYRFVGTGTNPSEHAAACIINADGSQDYVEFPNCDLDTSANDWLRIEGTSGDDIVVTAVHGAAAKFQCDWDNPNTDLGPWRTSAPDSSSPDFSFGLNVRGRGGSDELYGSPNIDRLYSSYLSGFTFVDDGELDLMCGYDGDDFLYGDTNDSSDYECLNGGDDSDYCDGWGSGSDYDQDCETTYSAGSGYFGQCQPNFWGGGVSWSARAYGCQTDTPNLRSWFVDCGNSSQSPICG